MRTALSLLLLTAAPHTHAQSVAVTVTLDSPTINAGQANNLHVFAQVVPSLRTNADRIFSWYLNVLNTNGAAASANYAALLKPASDNDPQLSSKGLPQGADCRGIYDTFLNLPGAGTSNAVELVRIPLTGLASGTTRFLVQAGSGVAGLSSDFLVLPKGGGSPYVGGVYTAAFADLTVVGSAPPCVVQLHATVLAGGVVQLTFTPCPSRTHTVEFRAALNDVAGWQPLPGAPYNSGLVLVTNSVSPRFFRVRASSP